MKSNSGAPAGRQAEPQTQKGKKRKPVNGFSHGYNGWRYCLGAHTHDGGGVAQDGGHTQLIG